MGVKKYQQANSIVPTDCAAENAEKLTQLYSLAQKKDRKVFDFFKKNAMNADHYMEFRKTCITTDMADVIRTKSYIVAYVLNTNSSFSYFVMGVDDTTNNLFCHRLPSGDRQWLDTDEKIRAAMGFDTECMDMGDRIRVQGDLTMRVSRTADTTEKLLEDLVYLHLQSAVSNRLVEPRTLLDLCTSLIHWSASFSMLAVKVIL